MAVAANKPIVSMLILASASQAERVAAVSASGKPLEKYRASKIADDGERKIDDRCLSILVFYYNLAEDSYLCNICGLGIKVKTPQDN